MGAQNSRGLTKTRGAWHKIALQRHLTLYLLSTPTYLPTSAYLLTFLPTHLAYIYIIYLAAGGIEPAIPRSQNKLPVHIAVESCVEECFYTLISFHYV